jgi:glycosyltransferase involved in cell wall biosynthesis
MKKQLHIVLLQPYEETPLNICDIHRRTAFLGKYLVERGHHITWVKNAFDHSKKAFLHKTGKYELTKNFDIIHVKGIGYKKNICPSRYVDDYLVARRSFKAIKQLGPIDGIVCSTPSVRLAFMACRYAKKQNIPFILDLRDPWPDSFPYSVHNRWLKRLIGLLVIFDKRKLVYCVKNATSLVAMSIDMLSWGLKKHPAASNKPKEVFYLSTTQELSLTEEQERVFKEKYKDLLASDHFRVFYLSKWGRFYQPSLLIDLANFLTDKDLSKPVDFVICGDGDFGEEIRQKANGLKNIFLPGFLSRDEGYFLAKHCHCAFAFIANEALEHDKLVIPSFPNKIFLLFASGLPIINGMSGEVASIIDRYNMGINFTTNDLSTMADYLKTLMTNETLRLEMSRNVQTFFKTQADSDIVYKRYATFVEDLILEQQKKIL